MHIAAGHQRSMTDQSRKDRVPVGFGDVSIVYKSFILLIS